MGFINERKNILRAEDGPLVAVDKDGNVVTDFSDGGSSCSLQKCQETVQFGFLDVDDVIDNIMSGSQSYFTASLVRDDFEGGQPFTAELTGQYINQSIEFGMEGELRNTAFNGIIMPPVEQAGGVMYPTNGLDIKQISDDFGGVIQEQYSLNVTFFDLKYQYYTQINGTSSIDFTHSINFSDNFEGIDGKIEIALTTDITQSTILSFTYAFFEAVYATASV